MLFQAGWFAVALNDSKLFVLDEGVELIWFIGTLFLFDICPRPPINDEFKFSGACAAGDFTCGTAGNDDFSWAGKLGDGAIFGIADANGKSLKL